MCSIFPMAWPKIKPERRSRSVCLATDLGMVPRPILRKKDSMSFSGPECPSRKNTRKERIELWLISGGPMGA